MSPEQHAKVMEALEEFSNSMYYLGDRDEVGAKACCDEASNRPHHPSCVAVEALSIMRAVQAGESSVRIPTSENEAALMTLVGMEWLNKHAPHRLFGTSTIHQTEHEVNLNDPTN